MNLETSTSVTGLPTNGSTIHIRVWYQVNGAWQSRDYTVTAAQTTYTEGYYQAGYTAQGYYEGYYEGYYQGTYGTTGNTTPTLTTPTSGSTLSGSTETFSWTEVSGATAYWLYLGSSVGSRDILSRSTNLQTSTSVTDLPTNGSTIHIRVWYQVNGAWQSRDYTVTAAQTDVSDIPYTHGPNYFAENYEVVGDKIYRIVGGERIEVLRTFDEDFEGYITVADMLRTSLDDVGVWTGLIIPSPTDPTVIEYVARQKCLVAETCDFAESVVTPSTDRSHTGATSLKTEAAATTNALVSKASVSTEFLHFVPGDDVYFSGWFYLEKGQPFTIMDLQDGWIEKSPGIRIVLTPQLTLKVDMKSIERPNFEQIGIPVQFPIGEWVHVKAHYLLDNTNGVIQLWQNDKKIVDAVGQTLPTENSFYNLYEVGISANGEVDSTLFVDDIIISNDLNAI